MTKAIRRHFGHIVTGIGQVLVLMPNRNYLRPTSARDSFLRDNRRLRESANSVAIGLRKNARKKLASFATSDYGQQANNR